jgi:glycosyltransferase involved in cell wall biosynthesis
MTNLSLLIPAYNEEHTIEKVIREHHSMLTNMKMLKVVENFEIIVLNDGSNDRTQDILVKLEKVVAGIKILRNPNPSGLQSAYFKLSQHASKEWFIVVPGDDQWPALATQDVLLKASELKWKNIIIGARIHKRKIYGPSRSLISNVFRLLAAICLKQDVIDPGSIKLMPSIINNFNLLTRSPIQEIEKLLLLKQIEGFQIETIFVNWQTRVSGKASGTSLKNLFNSILEIPTILVLTRKTMLTR